MQIVGNEFISVTHKKFLQTDKKDKTYSIQVNKKI